MYNDDDDDIKEVVNKLKLLVSDASISRNVLAARAYEIGAEDAISTLVKAFSGSKLLGRMVN